MRYLYLRTPHGDTYFVHRDGTIERGDQPGASFPGWQFRGIVRSGPGFAFGSGLIPFDQLTPERIRTLRLRYKNGRPRYTVADLDHGTARVWGNPEHHGVAELRVLDAEGGS